ncbi:MAG TPA: ABC transporter permease [Silvibacterium sp.]|nr:ABC transporter permease [Silvibacterium sp.]
MTDSFRRALNRLRSFFRKEPLDHDLNAEMASHLDFAIEENLRNGMSPDQARRQAMIRFGGVDQARQQHRETRGLPALDVFLQDLRYTLRTLRRDRAFTVVAVLILGLGIGANIVVFSVVNTILLRPLPFRDPQQLVWIAPPPQKCGMSCATYSADAYDEFRSLSHSYQDVTGYEGFTTADNNRLTGRGDPQPATSIEVIGNFFQVLGVQPVMGRLFTPQEALHGAHPVALLTYPWWHRQFNAAPDIVGKEIDLNGKPVTVVGVLPASFDFGAVFSPGAKVDFLTPLILDDERSWGNIVTMIGRLKPDATIGQAQAEAKLVEPHLCWSVKYPDSCGSYGGKGRESAAMKLRTLKDYVSGRLRRSLIVLWCAVGVILLIVCVNLSNLLLARAASRTKEFAMRTALGASRGRLIRQLLTESLVLSSAGAILGLGLAFAVIAWVAQQGSIALPLLSSISVDATALAWTIFIAMLAGVLFGLAPGLKMAGGNLQESLKDSGPGTGEGRKHERMRGALVISEVALACVLLIGAGLLLRSFLKVLDIDLGFQPDHAASIKVEYDDSAPTDEASVAKRSVIFQQILSRVSALPGVEAAGMADFLPLGQNRAWGTPVPKGKTYPPGALPGPLVYVITPGFVEAMGMRLHGRDFAWSDNLKSERVILINSSAAHFFWPDEDPVGRILVSGKQELRVVGIVDDIHADSVEGQPGWQIYYPATQTGPNGAQLVVRTSLPPTALAGSVLHALRELNPNQPAAEFRPIRTIVDRAVSPRRFFVLLVTVFAEFGLLLAMLGIYGVISYSVAQQTQEIGIRMALGATQAHVLRGVMQKTMVLAITGIVLGTVASVIVGRWIAALLFGTTPTDPATFAAMIVVMIIVALIAGYIPARRAARINPMVALRGN